jgi:hypothetical protein
MSSLHPRKFLAPVLVLGALLSPGAARSASPDPAAQAALLDRAVLADDLASAWSLAESLVAAPAPWAARGVAALTWLSRDLSRCDGAGALPGLARLLDRTDVDAWVVWAAWDVLTTNLERCQRWEALDALRVRHGELDRWRTDEAPATSGTEDAFFRIRSWVPGPGARRTRSLRWVQRTSARLFAASELCLEAPARVVLRLDSRAPGTVWVDGELVILAEPGATTLRPGPRGAANLRLDAGCHPVTVGLATTPGWGRARVRYLVQEERGVDAALPPNASGRSTPPTEGERLAAAHGAILRGAPHDAAALLETLPEGTPGGLLLRVRLEQLLDRRGPLEALVAQAAQPHATEDGAACLLWRKRLDTVLLSGGSEAGPWLELWPESCRSTLPGQLLEARHDADAGRAMEAASRAEGVEQQLQQAGLASCLAATTRTGQRAALGEAAPLLLDQVPFCRHAAFADAAARGDGADARRAADLRARLLAPGEGFPGALQLARRLEATGLEPRARQLLDDLGWFDPDLVWARADMGPDGAQAEALAIAAASPLATTDLRAREGMVSSWQDLEALAAPVEPILAAYLEAGWGDGPLVLVLDETVLRLRAQGRITERTTRVYHLRTQQAAQDWTDFQVPDSGQILQLRVRKADGSWREPDALGAGDLANLGELAEGDVVIMESIDELDPPFALADQLCLPAFYFSSRDVPVWRSRLVVRNETAADLSVARFWGAPPASELAPETHVFEASRLENAAAEEALQRWDAGLPRVELCTAGMDWPRLRDQLSDGLPRLLTPDPALRGLAADLARQPDPIRAAFDEVCRTVAIDNGGLFTRRAPEILAEHEGSGAVLLLALFVEMDIPATLVLVDPPGGAVGLPGLADPGVHTEPLLRVTRGDEVLWLDPFGPSARFGALRPFLGGRPGLLLEAGGPHLQIRVPPVSPAAHGIRVRWEARIREDGGGTAGLTIRFTGIAGASLWERFKQAPEERRVEAVASFAQGFFPAVEVRGHTMTRTPDALVFQVNTSFPAGAFDAPTLLRLGAGTLQRRYTAQSRRVLPILLDGEALTSVEVRLATPANRQLRVQGRQGSVVTDFGLHETLWEDEKVLTIRHHSHLADQVLPASRYDELTRFARTADELDRLVLVLGPPR